ncbi:MAG: S41 family peptidase [Chitinophagaceae bacterium]
MRKTRSQVLIAGVGIMAIFLLAYQPGEDYFAIAKNLDIFAAVYRDLNTYYVDTLQPGKLMGTGIEAMVQSLDPYTTYYPENDLDLLTFQTTGKYGGVGVSIRRIGHWTVISEVYPGGPMQAAGIQPGDILVSLDGQGARDMSEEEISKFLKGDPGSNLSLVIRNPVTGLETSKTITRREIAVNSVPYSGMLPHHIGYIRLIQFTQSSSDQVRAALEQLERQHPAPRGIILDLRSNPGGLLEEAVKVANLFLDPGQVIVSTRGKFKEWNKTYSTTRVALNDSIPVAVLTNPMTASASEIVAGALQDLDRGIIVGQRSFGKGLVQTTQNLPYHTKLKITTAKYYTPSGRCIQAIDYAHRNEDGTVNHIPDSLRKSFKTRDGRVVKDGGGISPDVRVETTYLSHVAMALLNQNFIFNFATRYYYAHPAPPSAGKFQLANADFDRFIQTVEGKDFDYRTNTEQIMNDLESTAKQEKYFDALRPQFLALQAKMREDKKQDILRNKEEIRHLLEEEIASRYFYQAGRIANDLSHDPEVKVAEQQLSDTTTYREILEGQGIRNN